MHLMKIALIVNKTIPSAQDAAYTLMAYFTSQGIDSEILPGIVTEKHGLEDDRVVVAGCDYVISLGGDGTTLHAARLIRYTEKPLLSFNFGHLGFLSSAKADNLVERVSTVLAGEVTPSRCATLKVTAIFEDGSMRSFFALNEVAITRGRNGHVIDLALSINGVHIVDLNGDGLLGATATGSTGYALSAGGPIVAPGHMGQVVVPIAPHTLVARPIVTGPSDGVEIEVKQGGQGEKVFFLDGEPQDALQPVKVISQRGPGDIMLVRFGGNDFYQTVAQSFFGGKQG